MIFSLEFWSPTQLTRAKLAVSVLSHHPLAGIQKQALKQEICRNSARGSGFYLLRQDSGRDGTLPARL